MLYTIRLPNNNNNMIVRKRKSRDAGTAERVYIVVMYGRERSGVVQVGDYNIVLAWWVMAGGWAWIVSRWEENAGARAPPSD